ncbi:MAG: sulfotransferase [Alphaproteobacteria bacterium]|nr:sulfotransferase [Alphaproteobacteria bacterium]
MERGRRPDFLCIGAAKAGTTWLYRVLATCPGYWMPPVKELRYLLLRELRLSRDRNAQNQIRSILKEIQAHAPMVQSGSIAESERAWFRHYVLTERKDPAWYFGLFSQAGDRLTGDISPGYALLRDPPAVGKFLPNAKVIFISRNPVDRDLSHAVHHAVISALGMPKGRALALHLAKLLNIAGSDDEKIEALRARHSHLPFEEMDWFEIYARETGTAISTDDLLATLNVKVTAADVRPWLSKPAMIQQQQLGAIIRRWTDVFGERFHTFRFEDLVSDPANFISDVTSVLGYNSLPEDPSILNTIVNSGAHDIEGLDELRAELFTAQHQSANESLAPEESHARSHPASATFRA